MGDKASLGHLETDDGDVGYGPGAEDIDVDSPDNGSGGC